MFISCRIVGWACLPNKKKKKKKKLKDYKIQEAW